MPFLETHFNKLQLVTDDQALRWAVHVFVHATALKESDRIAVINRRLTGCEFTAKELADEVSDIRRKTNRNSIEYISERANHSETAR